MEEEEKINEEFITLMSEKKNFSKKKLKKKEKTVEVTFNQKNGLLKFSHYFNQKKMGKKDGGYE